jgi:hypothetical protein
MVFDLSFAVASQGQWTELFDELHAVGESRVRSLTWSDNPISLKFLDFLDCCGELRTLDLSGCVAPQSRLLDAVVEFLSENVTLEKFILAGTHKNKLTGSDLIKVVRVLKVNATLAVLSVTKNEFDVGTLAEIAEILIGNVTLRRFKFSPSTDVELQKFWDELDVRKARLTVRTGVNPPLAKRIVGKGPSTRKKGESVMHGQARKRRRIAIGEKEENIEDYWAIVLPELPEIDDRELIEAEMQKYAVPALLAQLSDIDFSKRD